MSFLNVEIKARLTGNEKSNAAGQAKCSDAAAVRNYLVSAGAVFKGLDEQTDTYFNVTNGRLKLRQGNIETNLIFYNRPDEAGPKNSVFKLVKVEDEAGLKSVLEESMGIKMVVKKSREIYYIDNVKFHIDEVPGLGSFVEIEAGNILADLSQQQLQEQCEYYVRELGIEKEDMIHVSYSDMLAEKIK